MEETIRRVILECNHTTLPQVLVEAGCVASTLAGSYAGGAVGAGVGAYMGSMVDALLCTATESCTKDGTAAGVFQNLGAAFGQ